jgi:Holliday junction resolvase RusA-like endonuclease
MELISLIRDKKQISDELREKCREKEVLVVVRFHLLKSRSKSISKTRWEKDLDNMLKVVLDVLQENADEHSLTKMGLGLIESDKSIFGICCEKDFVEDAREEGVDIAIYDAQSTKVVIEELA